MLLFGQFKEVNERYLFRIILIFGLALKFYFIFFKDLNMDQITFIGFVTDPSWTSIFWDNYPPLSHIVGKVINLLSFQFLPVFKTFIFLTTAISYLFFSQLIYKKFGPLAVVLYSVLATGLVDATLIRPVFLIEFFATLNFYFFYSLLENNRQEKFLKFSWGLSAIGLLLSTYTAIVYFVFLAIYFYYKIKDSNSEINFSRLQKLFFTFILCLAGAGFFLIRWATLNWISIDVSFLSSLKSSFLWIRNLYGYSWFILLSCGALFLYFRNKTGGIFLGIIFLVNPILGRIAIEPRFILFLVPILIFLLLECVDQIKKISLKNSLYLLLIFFALWNTGWFLVNQRSDIEAAQKWLDQKKFDAFLLNLSRSTYFAINPAIQAGQWNSLALRPCPFSAALITTLNKISYDMSKIHNDAEINGYQIIEEKLFKESPLENIHIFIFEKKCK